MSTVTLEVGGLFEELDHLGLEKQLSAEKGVRRAAANPASGSVTVDYDETITSVERLRRKVSSCGFRCRGSVTPRHVCEPAAPAELRPAPTSHRGHGGGTPAQDEMAHEMGHGSGMDMADMVRDMRNRFWIALAFTIPIFIYSPMGGMFTPPAPPFGLDLDLWLFFLGSIAIVYPSWPFFTAAWRALRNGVLNMAVLVVLSVGTGYVFSVGSTFFFPGVQFYEAVAVLLVFILLGHWLEMRARAGASAAIRALLDLAPPMATVLRDGRE
ncbi:heavy metal translocating P-type ATPase, partial [Aurantimonas sp. LRZ36]